jgi:hypothetical protein
MRARSHFFEFVLFDKVGSFVLGFRSFENDSWGAEMDPD